MDCESEDRVWSPAMRRGLDKNGNSGQYDPDVAAKAQVITGSPFLGEVLVPIEQKTKGRQNDVMTTSSIVICAEPSSAVANIQQDFENLIKGIQFLCWAKELSPQMK